MKKQIEKNNSWLQKKWLRITLVLVNILLVLLVTCIISTFAKLSIPVSLMLSVIAILIFELFIIKFAMFPIGLLKVIADKLNKS